MESYAAAYPPGLTPGPQPATMGFLARHARCPGVENFEYKGGLILPLLAEKSTGEKSGKHFLPDFSDFVKIHRDCVREQEHLRILDEKKTMEEERLKIQAERKAIEQEHLKIQAERKALKEQEKKERREYERLKKEVAADLKRSRKSKKKKRTKTPTPSSSSVSSSEDEKQKSDSSLSSDSRSQKRKAKKEKRQRTPSPAFSQASGRMSTGSGEPGWPPEIMEELSRSEARSEARDPHAANVRAQEPAASSSRAQEPASQPTGSQIFGNPEVQVVGSYMRNPGTLALHSTILRKGIWNMYSRVYTPEYIQ
jgi:hypothetical protein